MADRHQSVVGTVGCQQGGEKGVPRTKKGAAGDSGAFVRLGPGAGLAEEPVAAVDEAGQQLGSRPGRRAPPGRPG